MVDFHHQVIYHARRTIKKPAEFPQAFFKLILFQELENTVAYCNTYCYNRSHHHKLDKYIKAGS